MPPFVGPPVTVTPAGTKLPSTSESLAKTSTTTAISSSVLAASFTAVGGSFTEPTVTVTFGGTKTKVVKMASGGVPVVESFQMRDIRVLSISELKELIK